MRITLSTLLLRQQLGEVLDRVSLRHDQFVIERKGKPLAAVVPVSKLEQMERFAREQALALLQRSSTREDVTDLDAMELANEAKHASRSTQSTNTQPR
jgi:prevent-host-death family protein